MVAETGVDSFAQVGTMAGMGFVKDRWIEAMQPTPQEWDRRWIPVSERLPEDCQRVIACFPPVRSGDPTDVCEATFNKSQGWFAMEHGCYTATHWMPLPEPPEVK
jgi:hypothetical protein